MRRGSVSVVDADAQLAARLLAREEAALRETVETYGSVVNGMAMRVLGNATLAEEVVQDTFLAMWRRPGAYDPERGSLKSFLVSIARNKSVDVVRKEESVKRSRDALLAEFPCEPRIEAFASELEDRTEVAAALYRIPEAQRHALVLAYFGGRTYRQVADELRVPEGTIKTRMRDGLRRLRTILSEPTERMDDD